MCCMLASADGSDGAAFLAMTAAAAQALLITVVLWQQRYGATNLTHCGRCATTGSTTSASCGGRTPPAQCAATASTARATHRTAACARRPRTCGSASSVATSAAGATAAGTRRITGRRRTIATPWSWRRSGYSILCHLLLQVVCTLLLLRGFGWLFNADTALSHSCSMATRAIKAGLLCCPEHDDDEVRANITELMPTSS